jgi:hypothetical protein
LFVHPYVFLHSCLCLLLLRPSYIFFSLPPLFVAFLWLL